MNQKTDLYLGEQDDLSYNEPDYYLEDSYPVWESQLTERVYLPEIAGKVLPYFDFPIYH